MGDVGRDGGCGDYAARTHAARLWLVLGESVREREIGVDSGDGLRGSVDLILLCDFSARNLPS